MNRQKGHRNPLLKRNPRLRIEFANTDAELIARLQASPWLAGHKYTLPAWLSTLAASNGEPSLIPEARLDVLRDGNKTNPANERRYIRNKAVIRQIYAELRRQREHPNAEYSFGPTNLSSNANAEGDGDDDVVVVSSRPVSRAGPPQTQATPAAASGRFVSGNNASLKQAVELLRKAASKTIQHPKNESERPAVITDPGETTQLESPGSRRRKRLSAAATIQVSTQSESQVVGAVPQPSAPALIAATPASESTPTNAVQKQPQLNPQAATYVSEISIQQVAALKAGVSRPFFERIEQDGCTIARLRQENATLASTLEQRDTALVQFNQNAETIMRLEEEKVELTRALEDEIASRKTVLALREPEEDSPAEADLRGKKRKASPESPMRMGDVTNGNNEHDTSGHLNHMANKIAKDLDKTAGNETIQLCGLAPLRIIATRPDEVLALAYDKLNAYPYSNVPAHWRRLYEDASLHKVIELLRSQAATTEGISSRGGGKRRKLEVEAHPATWVCDIVVALDKGIQLSGAPGRKHLFDAVFQQLENLIEDDNDTDIATTFRAARPKALQTQFHIARANKPESFACFQSWLNNTRKPLIIPGTMAEWPATQRWQNPHYLLGLTLGGRRLVPVEVGKSYTDEDWAQRIMAFRDFMQTYLLPDQPEAIGYLAQHDLFAQIPALKNDVMVPDYCYTTPPEADEMALKTAGLANVKHIDEPLLNAWLGPKGTKTPLHTDPYHNILCQIVGYKYVRLYAPSETPKVYPLGIDGKGVNMENTSRVDVSHFRSRSLGGSTDLDAIRVAGKVFPLFKDAKYQEAILGPGECLYIPLGWWHYVESLSTSFSVSFWWN